ncbi:PP2C family protein-serine/threonine phosphatase [Roseivivax sp. CAU 1753]
MTLSAAMLPQTAVRADASPGGAQGVKRVLIVDDSAAQLMVLARLVGRWGYEVMQARSGAEALRIAAEHAPDLVLSDWIMPGMDGIAFCRQFRGLCGDHFAYFILLSSRSEKSEIAQGLDAGADDYLSKPVNPQELRARIHAADRLVRMQRELRAKNTVISETLEKLQAAYAAIDRDLHHARRIQASLVPERVRDFGQARVSLLLQPCGHVGGDLVGAFQAGPSRIGIFGIDVSGHGIASSMVAARVAGYLSDRHPEQNVALIGSDRFLDAQPPESVAQRLNDRLTSDPGVEEYFTMLYGTFDLVNGHMTMVQAGHPNPLIIRADGTLTFVGSGGLPIGLIDRVTHERTEVALEPGDRLLIYSDGFIEADTKSGAALGEDGLTGLVRAIPSNRVSAEFLDDLYTGLIHAMPDGANLSDDISAALLEYRG